MTDPRGGPIGGASNWTAGYMPAAYQGTLFRGKGSPLLDLATPAGIDDAAQRRDLDLLKSLNEDHRADRPGETELAARIHSYELAYRMQTSAAEVVDLDREPAATREAYGLDDDRTRDFGRKCLMTRRLLEKGVRFIQLYSGGGHLEDTWDGHSDCITNHRTHAGETDKPIAALIADLKRTGLWDETLLDLGRRVRPHARRAKASASPAATTTRTASRCGSPAPASRGARRSARPTSSGFDAVEDRGPRRRPPRHDPAPDGPRPHPADLLPRRPRPAADRREGRRHQEGARVRPTPISSRPSHCRPSMSVERARGWPTIRTETFHRSGRPSLGP